MSPRLGPTIAGLRLRAKVCVLPTTVSPALGSRVAKLALSGTLRAVARGWTAQGAPEARLAAWARQGGLIELANLGVTWGVLDVLASGTLGLDGTNRPEGAVTVRVGGHRALIRRFVADGSLPADKAEQLSLALDVAALVSNDGSGRLAVPVVMRRGALICRAGPSRRAQAPFLGGAPRRPKSGAAVSWPASMMRADGAGAGEEIEQHVAVAPADRALQTREILGEAAQHFEHRFAVVEEDVAPHRRDRRPRCA